MKYKKSKFNFVVPDEDDKLLIFNSLRGTFSEISNSVYNGDFETFNEETLNKMKVQGIIVEENFSEDKQAFLKYMSVVNNGVMELIILPTMNCNFKCPYCYEDRTGKKMSDSVIESIVLFVKKNISRYTNLHVSWFGGEPLLCMDIILKLSERLMKIAKAYHVPYSSNITTNGYLLDVETFKTLYYKCKVTHYQITLDGREQFHNQTRPLVNGGPTYETIMNNLLNIKNEVKSSLFTIMIRTNLTNETLADLKEQLKEHEANFGDDKRFEFLFKLAGNWGGESVKDIYSKLVDKEDTTIDSLPELLSSLKPNLNLAGQFVSFDSSVCYAARQGTFTISPKGKVMRCTVHIDDDFNTLGVLNEKGELVQDETYYLNWQYCAQPAFLDEKSKCRKCPLYANCFGIMCPANQAKNNVAMSCNLQDDVKDLKAKFRLQPEVFKRIEVQ